ncbi:MAG: hypothetical protein WDO24_08065 [Pseudomonadota bacterium]
MPWVIQLEAAIQGDQANDRQCPRPARLHHDRRAADRPHRRAAGRPGQYRPMPAIPAASS